MTFPSFAPGEILAASDMNAVGLWLVKTQTVGTGVASVVVNDAFSFNYHNYRIIYMGGNASLDGDLRMTLGAAATGYHMAVPIAAYTGGAAATVANNNAAFWGFAGASRTTTNTLIMDIFGPQLSDETVISGTYIGAKTGGVAGGYGGFLNNTTSYTSFTLTPSTGTLTGGTIRVYGYQN
jgi:hypothetical protein